MSDLEESREFGDMVEGSLWQFYDTQAYIKYCNWMELRIWNELRGATNHFSM